MGSVYRKTCVRPVPAEATITTARDGTKTAKWTPRGAKRAVTAKVTVQPDGKTVVHVETRCDHASYRDHDGKPHVVSTKCKDKDNAKSFLEAREKQRGRVESGVITKDEANRVEVTRATDIDKHISDHIATLTSRGKRGMQREASEGHTRLSGIPL